MLQGKEKTKETGKDPHDFYEQGKKGRQEMCIHTYFEQDAPPSASLSSTICKLEIKNLLKRRVPTLGRQYIVIKRMYRYGWSSHTLSAHSFNAMLNQSTLPYPHPPLPQTFLFQFKTISTPIKPPPSTQPAASPSSSSPSSPQTSHPPPPPYPQPSPPANPP